MKTITRSQVMQRAWQLARLNRKTVSAPPCVGDWIAYAWKEAREGRTENWSVLSREHEARALRRRLTQAEMGDGSDGFRRNDTLIQQLRASLAELGA